MRIEKTNIEAQWGGTRTTRTGWGPSWLKSDWAEPPQTLENKGKGDEIAPVKPSSEAVLAEPSIADHYADHFQRNDSASAPPEIDFGDIIADHSGFTCKRCDFHEYRDSPIHNGRSTRRDCARCNRTDGFPVWNPEP